MPTTLRLFISYATEDSKIADAVRAALTSALPTALAYVEMDIYTVDIGADFPSEIQEKLDAAHVFIIIYTGQLKPSHGFTGQELGYFTKSIRTSPTLNDIPRLIVPIFLSSPPPGMGNTRGIPLDISANDLEQSVEQYGNSLQLDRNHAFVKFLLKMQDIVEGIWKAEKYLGDPPTNERDAIVCAKSMYTEIFKNLRSGIDVSRSTRPQKLLVIETTDAELEAALPDLPPSATLSPEGAGGAMSIFGLEETPVTWAKFTSAVTQSKYGQTWRDAIKAVVVSSLPSQIAVDNGQIVLSHDQSELYRVILTSGIRRFDGRREFRLYLVEGLKRPDYGDDETSLLLKCLELVCRYRFMFLEKVSPFVSGNISILPPDRLFDLAGSAVRELDWLKRDAGEAKIEDPILWARMMGGFDLVKKMMEAFSPHEQALRSIALAIRKTTASGSEILALREKFAKAAQSLADATDEINREFMIALMKRLEQYIKTKKAGDR